MRAASVFFLSDAHLGVDSAAEEGARTARLHDFLNSLPGRAASLYIVGDLFDFWFEYRTAIPRRHFPTLAVLQRLRETGLDIAYLNGNHDFWLGTFFRDTLGIRTLDGVASVEAQGRKLWLHHGDGLVGGDLGYRALRAVLRSRAAIALYGCLHPDLGLPLARVVSRWSRRSRGEGALEPQRLWREIAEPRFREGYDGVLIGHFHHAYERREPGREFFILGDWIDRFSYAELNDGRIELKTWPAPA
ncbi:MAG TPA: UDP-2,3-diacylglucosamine diphosphatase [Candidatus Eisenbacteria bacterium]|jgi:UDP-2,3-diacylglucosamine hydrolase